MQALISRGSSPQRLHLVNGSAWPAADSEFLAILEIGVAVTTHQSSIRFRMLPRCSVRGKKHRALQSAHLPTSVLLLCRKQQA